jgi:hypothetical protein
MFDDSCRPVSLHCWSSVCEDERGVQRWGGMFENGEWLRITCWPKIEKVTGGIMRYNNLYSSPSIIGMIWSRRIRRVGYVALRAYKVLFGKSRGKVLLERWVNNIKMDVTEIVCEGVDKIIWIKIWTSDGVLWAWLWDFGFQKRLGISWAAEQRPCSMHRWMNLPADLCIQFEDLLTVSCSVPQSNECTSVTETQTESVYQPSSGSC